jgi:hypothetical protein
VQQRRDKTLPQDGLPERCSVDDVDRYLRLHLRLSEGDALFAQQQMLERGLLVVHWREIDGPARKEGDTPWGRGPNTGQEGDISRGMWSRELRLARDSEVREGVDYATQRVRVPRDEVFIQELAPSDLRGKLELTLSARDVRMAPWSVPQAEPVSANSVRPDPDFAVLTPRVADPDFAALTPRVQLTVQVLDALEEQGMMIRGMPKDELRERVEKQADSLSPGATISPRTLSAAEAFRRRYTK